MKVVFICGEYPPFRAAGIGIVLRGLCEGLAAQGHEVHVVGCYPIPECIYEVIGGVHIHRLRGIFGRIGLIADRISLFRHLRKISETGAVDIIEVPDFEGPLAGVPRVAKATVVRLHGSHSYFARERGNRPAPVTRLMEYIGLRQADGWISCSQYTASVTKEVFGLNRSAIIVHNAALVPSSYERKTDYQELKKAIYFGTLSEKKGVLSLAEAWRKFVDVNPGWTLRVVGPDSVHMGISVRETMDELLGPALSSVEFVGAVSNQDLLRQLPGHDFAILPSYSEAFAIAPMEAMALGLPLVFTSLSSGPELVRLGIDGWLVDPRDVAEMAATLSAVAADSYERKRRAEEGKRRVEADFSYECFVNESLSAYERILRNV